MTDDVEPDDEFDRFLDNDDYGPADVPDAVLPPRDHPYDPEPVREEQRSFLAKFGIILFSVTVLLLAVPVVAGWRTWEQVQGLAAAILPTVSGIVSSTVVFYYSGSKKGP